MKAAVPKTARAPRPSWVRIPGPPPRRRSSVEERPASNRTAGGSTPPGGSTSHPIALVTQADRVRSLKPRDRGANPLGGTKPYSAVAQSGRGGRSRACSVEVRLLSALPNGSAARTRASICFARRSVGVRISPDPPMGLSSSGRISRFQRGRRRFESGRPYQQNLRGAEAAPGSHKPRDPGSIPGHATTACSSSRVQGVGFSSRIPRFESATGHQPHQPGVAQQPEQRSDMPPSGGASPPPRTKRRE
jgi:hypothetical protein